MNAPKQFKCFILVAHVQRDASHSKRVTHHVGSEAIITFKALIAETLYPPYFKSSFIYHRTIHRHKWVLSGAPTDTFLHNINECILRVYVCNDKVILLTLYVDVLIQNVFEWNI